MTQEEFNQISNKCEEYRYLYNRLTSYELNLESLDNLDKIYVISDGTCNKNVCPDRNEEFQKDLMNSIKDVYERHIIKTRFQMEKL